MDKIIRKYKENYSADNYNLIMKAFNFAEKAHEGQKRESGEPYFTHPCYVSEILVDLKMDASTIVAALLHDVLEDTPVTEDEMRKEFGEEVLSLVNGVTKLDKIKFKSKEEEQAENLRKMFFAMAKDIRVLIIKLADRLHNMRSLASLNETRRLNMARETLEIYCPLAGRLGISQIKVELDDLCMKYLYPEDYENLVRLVAQKKEERQEFVDKVCTTLKGKLAELKINGDVWGRPKHLYSIHKKMTRQNKTFDQIYDLIAVRVIVENIKDCYTVLGTIHTIWKPIPGRFKDYIAMPKPNLYQSLHTTVMTSYGSPFEIQIRTQEMHQIAEYGIAAHWRYKEGHTAGDNMVQKLSWLRETMDAQGDVKDSREFLDSLKVDLFQDEVFVFTPKGDVVDLPVGATVIDFAYNIHSQVGNKCVGAKVNNRIVPLSTELVTGDYVEVITSNNAKGPSRDWLKFAKSGSAKAKIRQFFKNELKDENIKRGREMLEREAKRRGYTMSQLFVPSWVKYIMQRYSISSLDDLYASVGYGGFTTNQILLKLIDFYTKEEESKNPEKLITRSDVKNSSGGVLIRGYDDFLVRLSHCCNPVPGDEIVGYISRGRGVSVHKADCPNMKNVEKERLIEARWPDVINKSFIASINIACENKSGLLAQITTVIAGIKIPINAVNAKTDGDSGLINVAVEIANTTDLDMLISKLRAISGVTDVYRASGTGGR